MVICQFISLLRTMPQIYRNQCYRNGPCLHGDAVEVSREKEWDYYDERARSHVYLECRLHQKFYSQTVHDAEEEEQYLSGMASPMREHGDLQLADSDGTWFTRSDDPESYLWPTWPDEEADSLDEKLRGGEVRTCGLCDVICDIRDDERYLLEDGSCPFPDPEPQQDYWKVEDYDRPCQDFLHPLLLQDLQAINRRRARIAKAHIWRYLREPKWMHALVNSGQKMIDVWRRNYQPATFYFNSFESVWLYIKNLPPEVKENKHLLRRIRDNLELSSSFVENLAKGEWSRECSTK